MSSLIKTDGQVLAALDLSTYADSVADHAGWAAAKTGAPLVLLHALDRDGAAPSRDLSGNLAFGSQEALLEQLATADAERAKLAQEQGRALLAHAVDHVAERFDLEADTRLRHGALVDTLLDAEDEARLFVIGKRGEHADFARGHLGSNLERVVRAVHRPVLVASRAFRPVQRFMIAFDGSATARKCVEMVVASPLLRGLPGVLLAAGDSTPAGMDEAAARLREAGFAIDTAVVSGNPDAVIAAQVARQAIDLLVMGAYGHSRIRQLIVGSTTTQVLRSCTIPVLLLR